MIEVEKPSSAPATARDVSVLGPRRHLRRALRLGALCSNVLYVGGCLVAVGILLGLGPAPWQAYANVLLAIALVLATLVLNVRAALGRLGVVASGCAIALNLACLAYALLRPEYSSPALLGVVVLAPVSNVALVVARRHRGPSPAARGVQT